MSPDWELQVALRTHLIAYAPLLAALAEGADSVRDHVKQGTPKPYLVIGEAASTNDDTKDTNRFSLSVTIHCWSEYAGRKEVKEILGHVYDALHRQAIAVNGYDCLDCRFVTSESFVEPDGKTRHGVMTFDVELEET